MDLPAYPAFVFQNQTSASIMPLRSHIHLQTVYSGFILTNLQVISNYLDPLCHVLFWRVSGRLFRRRKTSITQSSKVEYLNMNLKWCKWKAETETNRAAPPTVAG
jgi:hypothetical protein